MVESSVLMIHTDGASRGNPGAAAYAYVIARDGETLIEEAGCLGQMTNNQAEYTALVRALEHALEIEGSHRVIVHSDSELMVKQMNGEYRVKNEELRDLYAQACALRRQFEGSVSIRHVRRAENRRADELCNEALDGKREPMPRVVRKTAATVAPSPPSLRTEAISYLRQVHDAWAKGGAEPAPEVVWRRLAEIMERQGVRLPTSAGERG